MKKLLFFCFLVIAPSLFAEKIYLMDLYKLIPVEDEEVDWQIGNKNYFTQVIDYVEAELSGRMVVIQFHESVNEVWINVVDQTTGDAIVEESYTTPFVITIPLTTALPGEYMLEIYTGEDAYGAKFDLN